MSWNDALKPYTDAVGEQHGVKYIWVGTKDGCKYGEARDGSDKEYPSIADDEVVKCCKQQGNHFAGKKFMKIKGEDDADGSHTDVYFDSKLQRGCVAVAKGCNAFVFITNGKPNPCMEYVKKSVDLLDQSMRR